MWLMLLWERSSKNCLALSSILRAQQEDEYSPDPQIYLDLGLPSLQNCER
jgi:hypothetical protein